jgi:predicted RNA-binding protein YlxR (DUF448 family)
MESKPKRALLRIIKSESGVEFDPTGKANGRGIYLCRERDCFNLAKKKRGISRGLDVVLSEEQLARLLETLEEVFCCEQKDT